MKKYFKELSGFTIIVLTIIAMVMLPGCPFFKGKSVCMDIPPDQHSLICELLPTAPEDAELVIRLANWTLIKEDIVMKEDVLKFLDDTEAFINKTRTYADLAVYVLDEIDDLKKEYGGALIIISQYGIVFEDRDIPISDFDRGLLLSSIRKQRQDILLLF